MGQAVLRVDGLPEAPLDAAAAFYREHLPLARSALAEAGDLVLVFLPAGLEHRAWRLAAVQELARSSAPARVNGVAGDDPVSIAEALHFLHRSPGVTGQLLAVHGQFSETR